MRRVMNGLLRVASWWKVALAIAVCMLLNLPGDESIAPISDLDEQLHGVMDPKNWTT